MKINLEIAGTILSRVVMWHIVHVIFCQIKVCW